MPNITDSSTEPQSRVESSSIHAVELESQLRLIVEHSPAAVAMFDSDMKYMLVSRRWLSDYRLDEMDVIGRSHYDVFPDIPQHWKDIHKRCLAGAVEQADAEPFPRSDGSIDWVRWQIRPWQKSDGKVGGIILFSEVVTEHKQIEEAIGRYTRRLEILHQIDRDIINASSTKDIIETALKNIRQLIPCQRANVGLIDADKQEGVLFAVDYDRETAIGQGLRIPLTADFFEGYDERHLKLVPDLRVYAETNPRFKQAVKEGLLSGLNVILMDRDKPIGTLGLFADKTGFFTVEHQAIVIEIGSQLAIAIRQRHLAEQLAHYTAELEHRVEERTLELQVGKSRVEAILNNSSNGILLIEPDLSIQQANAAFHSMLGCAPHECHDRSMLEFVHEKDRDTLVYAIKSHEGEPIEIRATRKDGSLFDAELSVELIRGDGLVCTIQDITARKRAESAIRESEARYRLLAENVKDVIVKTSPDGLRTFVTPSVYTLLGYQPEELIGKPGFDVVHPEDRPALQAYLMQTIASTTSTFEHTHRMQHKDGHYIWVEVNGTIVRDLASGKPMEVIGVVRDVTGRKQVETELHNAERRYHALFEQSIAAVLLVDMQGRTLEVNRRASEIFGYTNDEFRNLTFRDLSTELSESELILQRLVDDQSVPTYERVIRKKDGSPISVEVNAEVVRDETGTPLHIQAVIRDISSRKRAEAAILQSEERFRRAVIDAPFPIMIHADDGEIIHISKMWTELSGFTHAEIPTMDDWIERAYPGQRQIVKPLIDRVYTHTEPTRGGEFQVRTKAGETRVWDFISAPLGLLDGRRLVSSMAMDVTERKNAELALQASEVRYRSLIETMHDGLAMLDSSFRLTYINDHFCKMVGYTKEEVVGKLPTTFLEPEAIPVMQAQLQRRRNGENDTYEVPFRHKDGHQVYVLLSGTPSFDSDGNYAGSFVVATDITVQKQAESTLRLALTKEKELGDLKTRFISMASHEFRTPLASILAMVETLAAYRKKLSEEQIDQRLEKMKEQVGYLKNIMEDVLMLSRMQARRFDFNPVKTNLDALARSVIDEFQTRADVNHQLEYTVTGSIREVVVDLKLMRQIISNLLSNAIKYSPDGKPVSVGLEYSESAIVVQISDEGIGIPQADLPHLFEPFHRGANVESISGTGLGLVIVKEAVELHRGVISVESVVDVGTTFSIHIPN